MLIHSKECQIRGREITAPLGQTSGDAQPQIQSQFYQFQFSCHIPDFKMVMKHCDDNWSVILSVVYCSITSHPKTEWRISHDSVGWPISDEQSFWIHSRSCHHLQAQLGPRGPRRPHHLFTFDVGFGWHRHPHHLIIKCSHRSCFRCDRSGEFQEGKLQCTGS